MKLRLKVLIFCSLLVGIGTVLHVIMPQTNFITPDLALSMMLLGIALFPEVRNVLLLGIVTGLLTALTTGLLGGQIPNMIDKPITAFVFIGLFLLLSKKISKYYSLIILTPICTIVSGTIFITILGLFFELPAPGMAMFVAGVLPAAAMNTILLFILYPIVTKIMARTKFLPTEIQA